MYIGQNIKHLRTILSISGKELAEQTGLNQSNISRYEKGSVPGGDIANRLANYFGIAVISLLNEDLSVRWPTLKSFEEWKKKEEAGRELATENFNKLGRSHYLLDALIDHYTTWVSPILGKSEGEVRSEIEANFWARVNETKEKIKGTSFGRPEDL